MPLTTPATLDSIHLMTTKNPYKVFGDYLIDLTEDHVYGEVLEDQLLELARDEGFESYKDYEEAQV